MSAADHHKFLDEWLLPLVRETSGLTPELLAEWRGQGRRFLSQSLVDHGLRTFEELGEAIQHRYRIAFGAPDADAIDRALLSIVPEKVCRKYGLVPLGKENRSVSVLMSNPVDPDAQREVEWASGRDVVPVFSLPDHLERLLLRMVTPDAVVYDLLERLEFGGHVEIVGGEAEEAGGAEPGQVRAPVIRLANAIIADAVTRKASDIHVEHEEQATVVRYRIDGLLRKVMVLPRYIGAGPLVSRIKIMAGLDLAERRRPQDGRAKLKVNGVEIGLRVSTLPTRMGEKIVFRILDERSAHVPLDRLGFHGDVLERLEHLIEKEEGILLVTGPTGSGKTTTLYSVLNRRNAEDVNIITVEDPVEYRLQGVSQVQVSDRQGLTFAGVLRSVLRQDPDVIMVGEIRDGETADIACQAALTGHLVLSTLHTNDAVTAVARLVDMGVERFKLASGLNGVTAQRLVRKVCSACSRPVEASEVSPELDAALRRRALPTTVRQAVGCAECEHSGYKGRMSLIELLEIPEALKDRIAAGAGTEELREEALALGCLHTMTEDILRHLSDGHTTWDEVQSHLDLGEAGGSERAKPHADEAAPVAPPTAVVAPTAPKRPAAAVVAVPDEAARATLHAALADGGVSATDAPNGQMAVALVAGQQPDLLVVGPPSPDLDVAGLIHLVRTVLGMRDLPVVAVVRTEEEADPLLEAGADDFLALPLRPAAVRARLKSVLGRGDRWAATEEVMRPRTPANEADRLADLHSTGVLDTPPEERFDRLTRKAAEHFGVPVSMVSLVDEDRQWFKSHHGTDTTETPRDVSFCGHAVLSDEVFVVEDAYLDARFVDNPLVTGDERVRFYAGYPLHGPAGQKVGSFCVIDHKARAFTEEDAKVLTELGRQVEAELAR
ncbi:MAG: ATPase, T2SS/T4P/T4SS family [Longimicrobiales bacterium]|nr:ATPase, T2SS/T4P/T4SS family [Longimicrobiales bacterium]